MTQIRTARTIYIAIIFESLSFIMQYESLCNLLNVMKTWRTFSHSNVGSAFCSFLYVPFHRLLVVYQN